MDGDARPFGKGYDLGADEFAGPIVLISKQVYPTHVQVGDRLTYTLRITNAVGIDLPLIITDTLPEIVSPTGILTWTTVLPASGGVWSQTVVVTVTKSTNGPFTNLVKVETPFGVFTATVTAYLPYFLFFPLIWRR